MPVVAAVLGLVEASGLPLEAGLLERVAVEELLALVLDVAEVEEVPQVQAAAKEEWQPTLELSQKCRTTAGWPFLLLSDQPLNPKSAHKIRRNISGNETII